MTFTACLPEVPRGVKSMLQWAKSRSDSGDPRSILRQLQRHFAHSIFISSPYIRDSQSASIASTMVMCYTTCRLTGLSLPLWRSDRIRLETKQTAELSCAGHLTNTSLLAIHQRCKHSAARRNKGIVLNVFRRVGSCASPLWALPSDMSHQANVCNCCVCFAQTYTWLRPCSCACNNQLPNCILHSVDIALSAPLCVLEGRRSQVSALATSASAESAVAVPYRRKLIKAYNQTERTNETRVDIRIVGASRSLDKPAMSLYRL